MSLLLGIVLICIGVVGTIGGIVAFLSGLAMIFASTP